MAIRPAREVHSLRKWVAMMLLVEVPTTSTISTVSFFRRMKNVKRAFDVERETRARPDGSGKGSSVSVVASYPVANRIETNASLCAPPPH